MLERGELRRLEVDLDAGRLTVEVSADLDLAALTLRRLDGGEGDEASPIPVRCRAGVLELGRNGRLPLPRDGTRFDLGPLLPGEYEVSLGERTRVLSIEAGIRQDVTF